MDSFNATGVTTTVTELEEGLRRRPGPKRSLGIWNVYDVEEVPGTVQLFAAAKTETDLSNDTGKTEKRTADGIVLNPQPDESANDPLNWAPWRRNAALYSLGLYCAIGGGMAPLLAAGLPNVAHDYGVTVPQVALTTGFYMLGLGLGGIIFSPTAIVFGKRPVYLATAVCFIVTTIWCAISPTYISLAVARICQGIFVSPVEVLASSTVSELFFLHERAFRLGIYTLLLLSGKNLMPLISAVIISGSGWRSVFWIIVAVTSLSFVLLVLMLPESYWDRTIPKEHASIELDSFDGVKATGTDEDPIQTAPSCTRDRRAATSIVIDEANPFRTEEDVGKKPEVTQIEYVPPVNYKRLTIEETVAPAKAHDYTEHWRHKPAKTWPQLLKPYLGRISYESWFRVLLRPFILFAYPAILWSALVYSLSIGWLIVLSESIADVYRKRETYNFTSLQCGLVYIAAFVGGVLGTALAGKVSDLIVRFMAKKNNGIYEPEYRLVMAIPVAITTTIGLMGFGWSVEERDSWIVPTVFFGIISFGCSLGSTTAITFAVDSYKQYIGESLVTLNFSKNIFHGLAFSLFFDRWLEEEGSKKVFVAIGLIQICCMLLTIPMYMFGKKARMWTLRKNLIGLI